ncbi:MAG: TIGR01777 family oxidoreductase [Planctomycetota bacterium]|nr:TIGR01777 family oxidoreductase [Planctomycetota bacterium]
MAEQHFERTVEAPCAAGEAYEWHLRPGALRRLLPPWDSARVVSGSGPEERLEKGARTVLRVGVGPIGLNWTAEIADEQPQKTFFVDRQVTGPFKAWVHRHEISMRGRSASVLKDKIRYQLPLGPLGQLVGGPMVRGKLERMFAWRHRVFVGDLEAHAAARDAGFEKKTIAITGASGLVGSTLAAFLRTGGHRVLELVRRAPAAPHEVRWDPAAGTVDTDALEGVDALVHLAGESIFGLRWTEEKKRRIAESRVGGTRAIVDALGRMEAPPKVLVAASAIGWYGDRGEEELPEAAPQGEGFLAETCAAWEGEVDRLPPGVRAVKMRLGVVLDAGGGALATMLPAFSLGLGGRLGTGRQWFPWIGLDDVVGAMHLAMYRPSIQGAVNLVAPGLVRNVEFTKAMGRALRRPTVFPVPRPALRMALGAEQADEMLLSSVRVVPAVLQREGFTFRCPEIDDALGHALGRTT